MRTCWYRAIATSLVMLILQPTVTFAADSFPSARLIPVGDVVCQENASCTRVDALVFVHGVYGGEDTFTNQKTGFNWPNEMSRNIGGRPVDIYRLEYQTTLFSWAKQKNPSFDSVAIEVMDAMKPLRIREYRTIGFIAHSLGGNIVSTYIHMVKTKLGHPQRSQNAFAITLATPVLGAQIADQASVLKSVLHMDDDLLASLKRENLYLRMLQEFRNEEIPKETRYACRPVHLHAAFEQKYLGPLLIVTPDSAAISISQIANSPVVGFPLNHADIAKPEDERAPVYRWVRSRIEEEYLRIGSWEGAREQLPKERRLCERMDYIPE